MGKTSAVNLVLAAIEDAQKNTDVSERSIAVRIAIWPTSGADILARSYLQQLEAALVANFAIRTGNKYKRQIGRFVRKATSAIEAGSTGVAIVSGAAAPAAGIVGKLVGWLTGLFGGWLAPETTETASKELRNDLRGIKGQLLVIIDDLDRLHPDEMRQLLTLVKTFGDLPRVTHLLLYDRQIVGNALISATRAHVEGPTYLEKIIQLSIALPAVLHWRLLDFLRHRLGTVVDSYDELRLTTLWRNELRDLLTTPRDIIRLVSSLAVSWPGIADHADFLDFVCLESIRLSEENVWRAVRDERYELVGRPDRLRPDKKVNISNIAGLAGGHRRESLQSLLERLFPETVTSSGRILSRAELRRRRAVGTPEYVDVYFLLQPGDALGASVIEEFLKNIDDEPKLRAMLMSVEADRSKLRSILNSLTDSIEKIESQPVALLNVLLDIGDDLLTFAQLNPPRAYDSSVLSDLDALLWDLLKRISLAEREQAVVNAMAKANSVATPAIFWQRIALRANLLPDMKYSGTFESLFPNDDAIRRVGSTIASRLREAWRNKSDDRLSSAPLLGWILKIWEQAGDGARAQDVARDLVEVDHSLVLILDAEMGESTSAAGTLRSLRGVPKVPGIAPSRLLAQVRARLPARDFLQEIPEQQRDIYKSIAITFEQLATEQEDKWVDQKPWESGPVESQADSQARPRLEPDAQ
jgi:hypothetical protein